MWLIVTLLWVPWAGLALWLARQIGLRRPINGSEPDAFEIARRSYARGDIDRERYAQIMADLSQGSGSSD